MINILGLDRNQLKKLKPQDVGKITKADLFHILKAFDNYWQYDYRALDAGKKGEHAVLKSGLCGDGFVNLREVLKKHQNIRNIIAIQLASIICGLIARGVMPKPTYIAPVPSAATELGEM